MVPFILINLASIKLRRPIRGSIAFFLAVAILMLVLQGCFTGATKSIFSSPSIADTHERIYGDSIRIETSDLIMVVHSPDQWESKVLFGPLIMPPIFPISLGNEPDPSKIPTEILISVSLKPKGQEISFSPMQLILRTDDGKYLKPKRFTNGGGTVETDGRPIVLNQDTSFYIYFDFPPYPNINFFFVMNGIEKDGKPVVIPTIRFQQEADWEFYWIAIIINR